MFPQQLQLPALEVGETWTLRISHAADGSVDVSVRVVTPGGSIVTIPVSHGRDVLFTAGADAGELQLCVDVGERDGFRPRPLS